MQCKYCQKEFKSEKNFKKHTCIKMKRFYSINQLEFSFFKSLSKCKTDKDIDIMFKYISSKYYNQLHEFSIWCKDMNVIEPHEYFKYLLQNNIHVNKWKTESMLRNFLYNYLRNEPMALALKRSQDYLNNNNITINDISSQRLYLALKNGFINVKYLKYMNFDYESVLDINEAEKNVLRYFLEI